MTILFHETLWLLLKDLDYNHVVSAEMAFQAVLNQPNNFNRVADLLKNYGTNNDRLQFAIAADLKTNALKTLLSNGKLSVGKLFSADWFKCYNAESDKTSCLRLVVPYVYELTQKYPEFVFSSAGLRTTDPTGWTDSRHPNRSRTYNVFRRTGHL